MEHIHLLCQQELHPLMLKHGGLVAEMRLLQVRLVEVAAVAVLMRKRLGLFAFQVLL
jgi:hypothetical protein